MQDQFEQTLTRFFSVAYQYWDSGNFKGYAASDDPRMVRRFLVALGNVSSKFSTANLPRKVTRMEESFVTYREWLKVNGNFDPIVAAILPPKKERRKMHRGQLRDGFGGKIRQAAQERGLELTDEDMNEILDRFMDFPQWGEFHISHYKFHC